MSKTLEEIVSSLSIQQEQKTDLIVPSSKLSMSDNGQFTVRGYSTDKALTSLLAQSAIDAELRLSTTKVLHDHLSDKLQIPRMYYERMLNNDKELLAKNVNSWLERQKNVNYMLRTFMINSEDSDGVARALLSDRFNTIDNWDVLMSALEAIKATGIKVNVESCDITDKKMYVRIVAPEIEAKASELIKNYKTPKGGNSGNPYVNAGFVISNSEVGFGKFNISPRLFIQVCSNGLIRKDESMSKVHLGQKLEENTIIRWSQTTQRKNMELVMSQVKDAVKTFLSDDYLVGTIDKLQTAGTEELKQPIEAVNAACSLYKLSDDATRSILDYFVRGGETTVFGLSQAVTYYAQHDADADDRFELEAIGGDVIFNADKYNLDFVA